MIRKKKFTNLQKYPKFLKNKISNSSQTFSFLNEIIPPRSKHYSNFTIRFTISSSL